MTLTLPVESMPQAVDSAPLHLTLAIPTFNGGDRLPQVLAHLQAQDDIQEIRWEILVVDNNSQDQTRAMVEQWQQDWPSTGCLSQVSLRYCFEPRQGLAFARQQAIAQAQGEWVAFVDDDNWLEPNWVAMAHDFAQAHPDWGAFSGCIEAAYEISPPKEFRAIEPFLAIRDHGDNLRPFVPAQLRLPPGAGLVVHRQRWLDCVPEDLGLVGRVDGLMTCGEDYAALLYLDQRGWAIGYNPAMRLRHWIPRQRLELEYLLKLAYGIGLSTCKMRWIQAKSIHKPWIGLKTFGGGLRRLVQALKQQQHQGAESLAPIARFQTFLFLGHALSPLYAIAPQRFAPILKFERIQNAMNRFFP